LFIKFSVVAEELSVFDVHGAIHLFVVVSYVMPFEQQLSPIQLPIFELLFNHGSLEPELLIEEGALLLSNLHAYS
jgi:hypothetical protein